MISKISPPFFLTDQSRLPLTRYLFKLGLILLALYTSFRVGFLFFFQSSDDWDLVSQALTMGLKFDLRLVGLQLLLLYLFSFIPRRYWKLKGLKQLNIILFTAIQTFFIFIYFSDFGHYAYLNKRLHFSILENFENPLISFQMAFETYPMIPLIIGLLIIMYLIYRLYRIHLTQYAHSINTSRGVLKVIERVAAFVIIAGVIYGKFSYFPLRWSEAYFSPDNFVSQLALNPVLNFFETLKFDKDTFDKNKVKSYYPLISEFLKVDQPDRTSLNFFRSFKPPKQNMPNIVFIQLESLAANKTSVFDNPLNPTPFLKEIADKSLVYKKFFTPTEATARGVFATLTGMPDVAKRKSSSRNPHLVDQLTILNQFEGYKKYYFLGGSANWGNIRSLFSNNIKDIEIYEEGSFNGAKRVDVWGISDLDLFRTAHKKLDATTEPFIAYVQSAGFHRPYTIPEDNEGFVVRDISTEDVERFGFISSDEFNSIKFQDHAFGQFMKLSAKSNYAKNTIYVIYGDHGIPVLKKSTNVPKGYYKHRLVLHHVPFVIYWPGKLKPEVDTTTIGGLHDILPTVSSIAGSPWKTQTLGRDLKAPRSEGENYSFIFSWHAPITTGLIGEKFYLESKDGNSSLYDYESEDPLKDISKEYPVEFLKLDLLRKGLYETTKYMRFHNRKSQR